MFKGWQEPELERLRDQVGDLLHGCRLVQAKRRERGAWVKPGLADSAGQLEKALLASYDRLAREVMASLSGRSDDVSSGRLAQAKKKEEPTNAEVDEALAYYGVSEDERDTPLDRSRLAAVLTLILLWRRRHVEIATNKAAELFDSGRKKALVDAGKMTLAVGPLSYRLKQEVMDQFQKDIDHLEQGLRDGTGRSEGMKEIVGGARSVGWAAYSIRRLFDVEQYRIGMLAEALIWRAWLDGYRAGAIEVTRAKLQENGVHLTDDLDPNDLTEAELEGVPQYEWVGPQDSQACDPCIEQFGEPVIALDESDLPSPEDVCAYGRACRHGWQLVSS